MAGKICVLAMSFICARSDILNERVSNKLLLVFLSIAAILMVSGISGITPLSAAGGVLIPLAALWIFFCLRLIGAGDIKLFCTAGAFMGAPCVLKCMLAAFISATVVEVLRAAAEKKSIKELLSVRVNVAVYVFIAAVLWAGGVYS